MALRVVVMYPCPVLYLQPRVITDVYAAHVGVQHFAIQSSDPAIETALACTAHCPLVHQLSAGTSTIAVTCRPAQLRFVSCFGRCRTQHKTQLLQPLCYVLCLPPQQALELRTIGANLATQHQTCKMYHYAACRIQETNHIHRYMHTMQEPCRKPGSCTTWSQLGNVISCNKTYQCVLMMTYRCTACRIKR